MKRPRAGEVISKLFRILRYGALVSLPAALLTFVKVYGYRWWMAFVFMPIFLFAWWIDPIIQRGEFHYTNTNNEEWQKMKLDVAEILKLLREKNESG